MLSAYSSRLRRDLGLFGQKKHYSPSRGHIALTWDGFIGDTTDISDETNFFGSQEPDDI